MRRVLIRTSWIVVALAAAVCGGRNAPDDQSSATAGRPTIVVSTAVWGDIVGDAFGEIADVTVIIPIGADPHEFAPSARQAEQMERADLVVVNGLGLEAGMSEVIDRVAGTGTAVLALGDTVATITAPSGGVDPHIWLDPSRVVTAVEAVGDRLGSTTAIDRPALDAAVAAAVERLAGLDASIETALATIPAERRLLVTNHESFGYFADRYGFEVVGAVVPSLSTSSAASASDLVDLAALIRSLGLSAIFAETTESDQLAQSLATEVGGPIEVVELYTESLGAPGSGADTYALMMKTDAARIVAALGS